MNKIKHISVIGLGNISIPLCNKLVRSGMTVSGVTDNEIRSKNLKKIGVEVYSKSEILKSIKYANSLIISVPPDNNGCPIIRMFENEINLSNISWIGYLSSTSVYGDCNGNIIDEKTQLNPIEKNAIARYKAEHNLIKFGKKYNVLIEIFRVSGIYGLENNVLKKILSNNINIIHKSGHFFNRIHDEDIARVLNTASILANNSGILNLSDDLPASQTDVYKYAFDLLGMRLPKIAEYQYIKDKMPDSRKKFWKNNRKVDNSLLNNRYGPLLYPTYKEGLKNIFDSMNQI